MRVFILLCMLIMSANASVIGKDNFSLLKTTSDNKRIYKDNLNGLIWHDILATNINHQDAMKICKKDAEGNIWRLPTVDEFREAELHGIRNAIPNLKDKFWTSSIQLDESFAWVFFGESGFAGGTLRTDVASVRCVRN